MVLMGNSGAGRLREVVTLLKKAVTRNELGDELVVWSEVARCRAEVAPLSGAEFHEASQERATITLRLVIRWRPGVLPEMQVAHGAQLYRIHAVVNPKFGRNYLQLLCSEVVA
jgi:SPP1 family predicted phage head-tail adaptor